MININDDISVLTTIPKKTLDKLSEKVLYIICEAIEEDALDGKTISEFNFFDLFTLYIKHDDTDAIRYKIVPNEKLESNVTNTAKNKLNLLEDVVNKSLARKFEEVYKNLC